MPDPTVPHRFGAVPRRGTTRTPAGVWVVVGLGVFLMLAGFGIAAFIAIRALQAGRVASATVAAPATVHPESAQAATAPEAPAPVPPPVGNRPADAPPAAATVPPPPASAGTDDAESMRREVLERIDLMPNFSQKEKDELYAQVQRARSFTRVAVLTFPNGRTTTEASQGEGLRRALSDPAVRAVLQDPTAVWVALGYADTAGDEAKNLEISRTRAEGVIKLLKERLGLTQVMHAIGMGGQDLFDKANRDKNRVVELWAVLP